MLRQNERTMNPRRREAGAARAPRAPRALRDDAEPVWGAAEKDDSGTALK